MCIYFIKNDNDAAKAISSMLTADPAGSNPGKIEDEVRSACHVIRCQKPTRCVGDAMVIR